MSEGSATSNENATASMGNQGEFSSRVAGDGPQTTHGVSMIPPTHGAQTLTKHKHKAGVLATEADKAPEFNAETLPAGSAPASRTFQPNAQSDVNTLTETTNASDTITGATSGDVHTGLGHPGQGQSSNEMRNDGGKTRGGGLQGVGATGAGSAGEQGSDRADFSTSVAGATQKTGGEGPERYVLLWTLEILIECADIYCIGVRTAPCKTIFSRHDLTI